MTGVLVPLKHLALLNPETLGEDTDLGRPFRYIDIGTTGRGVLLDEPEAMTFATSPSRARRVVRPGDTILSTVRTYLRAGWTHHGPDDDLVASTGFVCLRPRPETDPRFLGWLAQADSVVEEVVARSVGVSYPAINPSEVGRIKVRLPSLPAQRAIADYLDRETARITDLIDAKGRMTSLFEERLAGAISHFTRAAAIERADGQLPAGWESIRLRRCLASADYGIGDRTQAEGAYAVLGMSNIDSGRIVGPIAGFVPSVQASLVLEPGDLLFNRTNSRELVGKVGLVRSIGRPTTFASYLVRLRVNEKAEAQYLNYLLNTREVLGLARSMALPSIGQANLNPSRYSSIVLPMPPLEEQRRIVRQLDDLASRIGTLVQAIDRQRDLLQERRQALITAAVAGHLDIPAAA